MLHDIVYSPLCLPESMFLDWMSAVSLFNQRTTNTFINFIATQAEVNVALGKKAYQSSSWNDHAGVPTGAAGAVDGNTDADYYRGSCSSTNPSASPWWIVDLGRHCSISHLRVYNRDILGKFLLALTISCLIFHSQLQNSCKAPLLM